LNRPAFPGRKEAGGIADDITAASGIVPERIPGGGIYHIDADGDTIHVEHATGRFPKNKEPLGKIPPPIPGIIFARGSVTLFTICAQGRV